MNASRTVVRALVCGFALLFCSTAARPQETATLADTKAVTFTAPRAGASTDTPPDAPSVIGAEPSTDLPADPSPQASQSTAAVPSDETSDSKWHIYSVGYVWLPGINGTAGVLGYNVGVHVSVWDLLSKFRFGIIGTFIPSYNRWSAPADFIWMRFKDDKSIAFNPAYSIQAKATASIFNPRVTYLVVKSPKVKVSGNVGLRYWHLGNTLNLEPPGPLGRSLYRSANWVDCVAGGRFSVPLSQKIWIDILGDAGGGGANLDYQVAGFANYKWNQKLTLLAGWRYLTVHYQGSSRQFLFDASMSGMLFGGIYRFR